MEEEYINNPHDKFFKLSFSDRETVLSFIEQYLPIELQNELDLSTLEIYKDSFIDKNQVEQFSDMLYKVQKNDGGARLGRT